jgi:hypothetical protein
MNKKLENITTFLSLSSEEIVWESRLMNKVSESVIGQLLWAGQTKVVRSSLPSSRLSKLDRPLNHIKPCKFFSKYSPAQRAVLISLYLWQLFCKEQTKIRDELFEIQIIGLEQDVPLLTKEALWKK